MKTKNVIKKILKWLGVPTAVITALFSFSAWWHSPTTQSWLFPTFNYIYEHAHYDTIRKVLDVLSDIYQGVDKEFYQSGLPIEEEPATDETEALKGGNVYSVPTFQEQWNRYQDILPTAEEQGQTNECVLYTMENIIEYNKRQAGLDAELINMSRHNN